MAHSRLELLAGLCIASGMALVRNSLRSALSSTGEAANRGAIGEQAMQQQQPVACFLPLFPLLVALWPHDLAWQLLVPPDSDLILVVASPGHQSTWSRRLPHYLGGSSSSGGGLTTPGTSHQDHQQQRHLPDLDSHSFASSASGNSRDHRRNAAPPPPQPAVVYEGPLASTLQKVKLLSLSTCCLSVSCGPALTFFTSSEMSVIGKGAIASTMILLSASTTAALHWVASPYVRRLTWVPGSKEVEVEILSWMATSLRKTVRIADVTQPETQRPLVTFAAGGDYYFIDKDKFPSAELLQKLSPASSSSSS